MSECYCGSNLQTSCEGHCVDVEVDLPVMPHPEPESGRRVTAVVSSTGPVCKREFVHKELEYVPRGESLRWVTEGVRILNTAELSQGRVGVVFAQNGKTKFKVLAIVDGELAMGNTLVILDDVALSETAVVELTANRAAILYAKDNDGMVAVVTLDDRRASLAYVDDIWSDGGNPTNIAACVLPSGWLMISAVLRAATIRDGGQPGECWVFAFRENATRGTLMGEWQVAERMDTDNDTDTYAGGWSMAAVDTNTAVLVFPRSLDKPVGFAVIDIDLTGGPGGGINFRLIGAGKYANTLPTIQVVGMDMGRWFMSYGVCWLSNDTKVNKSALASEVWGLSRYAAKLLWYGIDEVRYQASMGGISAASSRTGVAVTYTGAAMSRQGVDENTSKVAYIGLEGGPAPGAAVSLPENNGWIRVVPISVSKAILVYSNAGDAFAQVMELEERVIPVDDATLRIVGNQYIDGYAITGGAPNTTITIQIP